MPSKKLSIILEPPLITLKVSQEKRFFGCNRFPATLFTNKQKQEAQLSQRPHGDSCHWIFC